jgi:hypothetical protein
MRRSQNRQSPEKPGVEGGSLKTDMVKVGKGWDTKLSIKALNSGNQRHAKSTSGKSCLPGTGDAFNATVPTSRQSVMERISLPSHTITTEGIKGRYMIRGIAVSGVNITTFTNGKLRNRDGIGSGWSSNTVRIFC